MAEAATSRTISAKFLHSADRFRKKASRLGRTCLKSAAEDTVDRSQAVASNFGDLAKARPTGAHTDPRVSGRRRGWRLPTPSRSLITSLFRAASAECAISCENWCALSSQMAETKDVARNESYVGTKDS